jgi:hypothetical protein
MKKFVQSPWGAATVTAAFFLVIMGGVAVMAKSMIDSRFKEASKSQNKGHADTHGADTHGGDTHGGDAHGGDAHGTEHAKDHKTEPNAQTNTESHGTVPEAPHEATSAAPTHINTITIEAPAGQPHHPDVGNSNESHDAHGEESHTEHKADADHGSEEHTTDSSHAESHGNEADAISHERPTLDLRR